MTTVQSIYDYLDSIAPFDTQVKHDNCGLLIGDKSAEVKKIIVCLDVTSDIAKEDCDLIISHHPLMYIPVQKITSGDPIHTLIQNNTNFIAAHTNLDIADNGVTDEMLVRLGFPKSDETITDFGKITELEKPISATELAEKCKTAFDCSVIRYVDNGKPITRIGVCSGGGGDLVETALEKGCDAYICGDLRWNSMVYAYNFGLTLIDAGHFHTEDIICEVLVKKLKTQFPELIIEKSKYSKDLCSYVA
ncbi:MAG: Nif3-like dinuclear metal center hexameric protein [Oscillospiraceae bacterium]|nr:Nif3-like dinuclear metal center hexameric protein [Oscillospiraceae bacterium]